MNGNNTYHEGSKGFNLPESCRTNPFTVPADYFDNLAENTHIHSKIDKLNKYPNGGFSVPEGYFEDSRNLLTTEAKLPTPIQDNGFTVPTDYFTKLETQITPQIRLASLMDKREFDVPSGYFEQLPARITSGIFEEKLKELAPVTDFETPPGYFEELTQKVTAKLNTPQTAPVRRMHFQRWIQYAAAACVAVVLGVGSYNTVVQQPDTAQAPQSALATIPEEEIISYLASSPDNDDMVYYMEYIYQPPADSEGIATEIEEEDIEDYLNYML